MKRILIGLLTSGLLIGSGALQAEQYAVTLRDMDLRDGPYRDATGIARLGSDTRLQVLARKGGWYQISYERQTGWVRLTGLRLEHAATGKGNGKAKGKDKAPGQQDKISSLDTIGDALSGGIFSTGRGRSSEATSTSGIRGLDEKDIGNASPNPQALAALDKHLVDAEQARRFAEQQKLHASKLDYLQGDSAAKGGGGLLNLFGGGGDTTSGGEE